MERGRDRVDLAAAPRHHRARRQALHGQGCPVHLGSADRQGKREASRQSPQLLVSEPSGNHDQRRLRGHVSSHSAAAGLLALPASGYSPIYPCHVPPRDMRQHPIGTGPFKFVEFKPNEYVKVTKNPDYWKKGRPYLNGIEYTIIRNLSTAILAFV